MILTENEINALYTRATNEACTTDCGAYAKGTCRYRHSYKYECLRWRDIYRHLKRKKELKKCQAMHHHTQCTRCEDYYVCPLMD